MPRAWAPALAFLLTLAGPAATRPEGFTTVLRDGGALLYAGPGGARLAPGDGGAVDLPLPPQAELTGLVATAEGWLAAGAAGEGLLLLAIEGGEVRALPTPDDPGAALRQEPQPLVRDGRLAGLAWLEGGDRQSLAVRAAAWDGAGWLEAETVAPPGPGSQLALAGAVLADGTWLLVWSAFDGGDDEILWSRRSRGTWSPPQRLAADNPTPDIAPRLLALGDQALAAWSRYDGGHYRLMLARFSGRGWEAPRAVGPPGSLYPSFHRMGERTLLLYRTARPRTVTVLELDRLARVQRRAVLPDQRAGEPVPTALDGGGIVLAWPPPAGAVRVPWEPLP